MPNLTDQEKAELSDWFRALEDKEDRAKDLEQMEAFWEQYRDYHQDRFLYSDRL